MYFDLNQESEKLFQRLAPEPSKLTSLSSVFTFFVQFFLKTFFYNTLSSIPIQYQNFIKNLFAPLFKIFFRQNLKKTLFLFETAINEILIELFHYPGRNYRNFLHAALKHAG